MQKLLFSIFIVILWLPACIDKKDATNTSKISASEDKQESNKRDSVKIAKIKRPLTEDDFLMIINYTPFNSSYKFIQQLFPKVSELNVKFRRYYKAYLDTTILNKKTKLEFTFNTDNTLQNVRFFIYQLNYNEADSLYKELQKYYSNKFGKFMEEIEKNPGSSGYPIFHGSYWKSDDFDITVGLNENFDNSVLAWGFQ